MENPELVKIKDISPVKIVGIYLKKYGNIPNQTIKSNKMRNKKRFARPEPKVYCIRCGQPATQVYYGYPLCQKCHYRALLREQGGY